MAGITSSFPFKPLLSRTKTTPSPPLSFTSFESKLFGLRLCNPNFSKHDPHISLSSSSPPGSITARYGGGGGGSRSGSRRPQQSDIDDDALDMSSIRSASVRLIDEQQNMVGVVSKSEAIRIAQESELDLVILSPDADPPVVRIMDYNKYRYELQKKKREQQKKSAGECPLF